ncbi:AfsR/SARP family transcriptional regulator [Nonomuraea sp. NPDC050536]|uniref:AfsR/SARP family transcriptional regulator n=1 Tax=Nonomuraea sp. NPDC050536 TaxID=3364366 RepID=UPI0037CC8C1F
MRVGILGPLQVEGAEIGGARLRWLLVRLALAAGRPVTVEELAEALWPEARPADPANAVQSLVSRLRRALPEPAALASVPGGYRLQADTDEREFHDLVRQAAQATPATAADLLDQALALWRGPALGEVSTAPFAQGHVVRLEESHLTALEQRAEAHLKLATQPGTDTHPTQAAPPTNDRHPAQAAPPTADGNMAQAARPAPGARKGVEELVAELGELAARHPLREHVHALRIEALRAAGRHAEALAAYEEIRARLAEELGADPGPRLRELHALLLARPEPIRPVRTNLRLPLTSFVGRAAEVERLRRLLREQRLVTLVGPGGAGKTRLATTVAATLDQSVWLAELAPVTDPDDVAQAVLGVLGQRPVPAAIGPRDTVGRLVEALAGPPVLLVLDNCEHLLEAVAHLAEELLGRCPGLRVLATSREPLAIGGESLCPVPPLPVEPAVRLFTDRVAAVRPGFGLDDGNAETVREICRRLDGLPLAIELAAARLRALTLRQLADRLDDRFLLLSGGSRTALPRHQTLRAVVAWSWDLLEADERRLIEQLSVFSGGFDLPAAEHLGGTLDLLAALVDKSLLQPAGEGRYRMLETIREYGLERLAESGRIAAARAGHAAYFVALAERREPQLRGHGQLEAIEQLLAEHDNLLAALHFAVDSRDADTAVRLAAALGVFWTIRGSLHDSASWLRRALEVPGPAPRVARVVASAVYLINGALGDVGVSTEAVVRELSGMFNGGEPELGHPILALLEPAVALFSDDYELGMAAVERRLSHPDPWARGMLLLIRAAIRENDGDMAASRADLVAATEMLEPTGERWALSLAMTALAEAHTVFGDYDLAIPAMQEAMRLMLELNPDDDPAHQRVSQATIRIRQGQLERARAELDKITSGGPETPGHEASFARSVLGDLARAEGDLERARKEYEAAEALLVGARTVAPQFRALVLAGIAHLAVACGELDEAAASLERAVELTLLVKDMPVLARVGVAVAELRACQGRPVAAAETLGAAEQLRGAPDAGDQDVARIAALLRDRLGQEYDTAYARGRALRRADALALVCDHLAAGQVRRR